MEPEEGEGSCRCCGHGPEGVTLTDLLACVGGRADQKVREEKGRGGG